MRPTILIPIIFAAPACSPLVHQGIVEVDTEHGRAAAGLFASDDAAVIVATANALDFVTLDREVQLDVRAAESIVALRPFADLDALDAAPWVGPSAMSKLLAYGQLTQGTSFTAEEAGAIVTAANTVSEPVFVGLGIDPLTAAHLVYERPYADLQAVQHVWGVDAYVLQTLLEHRLAFEDCTPGTAWSTTGLVYDSLDAAVLDTPVGGEIALCDGDYLLSVSTSRLVRLSGTGPATTVALSGSTSFAQITLEHLQLTGNTDVHFDAAHAYDVGVELGSDGEVFVFNTNRGHTTFHASRLEVRRLQLWDGTVLADTTVSGGRVEVVGDAVQFWDTDVLDGATVVPFGVFTLNIEGGSFHGNGLALDLSTYTAPGTPRVRLIDVDFGLGATDNGVDVRFQGGEVTWFHAGVMAQCDRWGCTDLP